MIEVIWLLRLISLQLKKLVLLFFCCCCCYYYYYLHNYKYIQYENLFLPTCFSYFFLCFSILFFLLNLFYIISFSHIYQTMNSTFTMANICPQAPLLNKGFWAKFEAWLRFMHIQNREFEVLTIALKHLCIMILFCVICDELDIVEFCLYIFHFFTHQFFIFFIFFMLLFFFLKVTIFRRHYQFFIRNTILKSIYLSLLKYCFFSCCRIWWLYQDRSTLLLS